MGYDLLADFSHAKFRLRPISDLRAHTQFRQSGAQILPL